MSREWFRGVTPGRERQTGIDSSVAHSARVYNYLLGGKDNFAVDREAGDQMILALPDVVTGSRANRAFLSRAVRYLVAERGIRQFLDIGTGLPTANNTHEVAQAIAPSSRVVYVDNDPLVLTHARALLTSTPEGATAYLDADLRDPDAILAEAQRTLDFSQPIAIMLLLILHMIPDSDGPHRIVSHLVDAAPSGSHLVLSHPPSDIKADGVAEAAARLNARMGDASMTARSHDEVARFFEGMELADPGVAQNHELRPDPDDPEVPASLWCGVARKP